MKRTLAILLTCILLLLMAGGSVAAQNKAAGDPLLYHLYLNEKTNELSFLVFNISGQSVDLKFPGGKDFDLEIRQNGKTVWRVSDGQMYTLAMRSEKMNSGTAKLYKAEVPKLDAGSYEVLAYFEGGLSRGLAVAHMELKLGNQVIKKLNYSLKYDQANNQVTFVVTNPNTQRLDLTFSSGKQYDLAVSDKSGNTVWRLSDGKFYTEAIVSEKLDAGKSKIYNGQLPVLKAGEYTLKAYFYGAGDGETVAATKFIVEEKAISPRLKFQAKYHGGRQPQISLMLKNISGRPVSLQFPTSQIFDIVIKRSDGYSWRYSDGRSFAQNLHVREFKPGVTRYTFVYLPQLERGNYTADIYYMGVSINQPVATTSFTVK